MTLLHHLDTWFERYLALSAIATLAWCFAVTRYKARQRADITRRATYPPPVPPPASCRLCEVADDLAAELAAQPVDVWLTPELSDRLFDELIAMEGLQ